MRLPTLFPKATAIENIEGKTVPLICRRPKLAAYTIIAASLKASQSQRQSDFYSTCLFAAYNIAASKVKACR